MSEEPGGEAVEFVNPDGSFVENFHEKLGDEFANDAETLKRYQKSGVKGLFKKAMEAHRKLSMDPEKLVQIPDENSSDEVRAAFHKARGKPEKAEDYQYELPGELREKVELNDDRLQKFKKFAHEKLHLSPAEFKDALNFYYNDIAEGIDKYDLLFEESQQKAHDEGMTVLKRILGDSTDERTARANMILRRFGEMEVKDSEGNEVNPLEKLFEESPQLKNSPWMTLILDNIAQKMSEDTLKGIVNVTTPTVDDLDARINELRSDPAYNNRMDPKHKSIQAEVQELYKKRYPA